MARIADVRPEETTEGDRTVQRHPSFGQITVNRISGSRTLYGSDFEHNGFVRVAIHQSELHRSNSRDWPFHSLVPLIEIDMSEAQWGSFVSSFGVGMGTQCTLNVVGSDRRPGIPLQERARLHFGEGDATVQGVMDDLNALREKVTAGTQGLSKARQSEMLREVDSAIRKLKDALPFIARSFAEEMEEVVEKAKTEVHAYTTNTIMRAGLAAIGGSQEGPLLLPNGQSDPA